MTTKCNFKYAYTECVTIDGKEYAEVNFACSKCGTHRVKRISSIYNINCEVAE